MTMPYGTTYECPDCGDSFTTKAGRAVHRRAEHDADVSVPGHLR